MVNITASLHPIFFANFAPKKTLVSASSWFDESSIWQAHETVIAVIDHVSASFYRYKHYLLLQSCKRNSRSSSLFEPREVLLLLLWKLLLRSHSCDSYGSTSAPLGVLIRLNWRYPVLISNEQNKSWAIGCNPKLSKPVGNWRMIHMLSYTLAASAGIWLTRLGFFSKHVNKSDFVDL